MSAMITLASVVLGAVLALGGGIATERWKQRREARAASRLVWLELSASHTALLAAVAFGTWPDALFSDDAWIAQRDRLALVRSTQEFDQVQGAYGGIRNIARKPVDQGDDPVLYWATLKSIDRSVGILGEAAGVEQAQLDKLRTPLQDRVEEIRVGIDQVR